MHQVTATMTVQAPLGKLWKLAQQVERMPEYMDDLESVEIVEDVALSDKERRTRTRWVALIQQLNRKVRWEEEDIWNDDQHLCTFDQVEGDFTHYSGEWHFEEIDNDQTRASLVINYAIEIPLLGALIQNVIKKLMQQNCDTMLNCLKAEAEK